MYICSYRHEEIVHEDRVCPMCKLIDAHNDTLDKLASEYQDTIDNLTDERDEYRSLLITHLPELLV